MYSDKLYRCCMFVSMLGLFGTFSLVKCSYGDRDDSFQICTKDCINVTDNSTLPQYLSLLFWNIESDCEYKCMFKITNERITLKLNILQYYGKWPFLRFYGIQEPASVLFCVLHCIAQSLGWWYYKQKVSLDYKFYNLTKFQYFVSISAWICACVFHTRDFYWTEKLDYFSATCVVGLFVFTFFTRIIGAIYDIRLLVIGIFVSALFGYHIYYMAVVHFDYGYNMKFMVCNGVVNILLWLIWCWYQRKTRPYVWKCALTMSATFFLAALELWDFPPIFWIVDGHALWHLGTVPFSYLWYSFLIDEASHDKLKIIKLP